MLYFSWMKSNKSLLFSWWYIWAIPKYCFWISAK